MERDLVPAPELVDPAARAVADRLHACVHVGRELLETRDAGSERGLVARERRDRGNGGDTTVELGIEQIHDLGAPPDRCHRQAAADRLAHRGQVGHHSVVRLRASVGDRERDHLVEDQDDAEARR